MSTEREPLLSEDTIKKYAKLLFDTPFGRDTYFCGAIRVRDHYENLLKEGKLREVKEVTLKSNDYDCMLDCSDCAAAYPWDYAENFKFCPGCGNPIKH